jgi:hypothetical protein
MRIFIFSFVLLVICGSEAGLLVSMCGGSWLTILPMMLIVVPALLAGVDAWHFIRDRLPKFVSERRKQDRDFVSLALFVACWLITSVPVTAALLVLYWCDPQTLTKIDSGFDCWRMAMSICIWHGFLSLSLITRGEKAFSISYFVAWLKRLSHREAWA